MHILVSALYLFAVWAHKPQAHDLKLSVCEIAYRQETESFELTFYLFQDDFKSVLYGNPDAPQLEAKAAAGYVADHFEWQINKRRQELHFAFMREKNDQVALQFTSPKIPLYQVSEIRVKSDLLIEKFREQVNMIYAILPQQGKKVQMLTAKKTEGHFDFK